MRLTAEQVRQGLLHDDLGVRQQCLAYFTDMWSRDESVMTIVTHVIDARGPDAFEFFHRIDQLAQSDATIEWVIRSLRQAPEFFTDRMISDFRPRILTGAKGELLARHRDDVLSVLPTDDHESVNRRLQFLGESPATLWERLEATAEQHKSAAEWRDFPHAEVDDLVTCLAELGSIPIDRMMELLQTEVADDEDSAVFWLRSKLVTLAGLIRHEPVLPVLIKMLRVDHDALSEESQTAMIRLGTDDVIRAIEATFLEEEWHWQLYASSVFGHIHSDETFRAATGLLHVDSLDEDIRQNLSHGLACQFSTEGLETVGKYLDTLDDWLDDPEWTGTLSAMQATSKLLQINWPQLDDWQAQIEEAFKSGRASLFRRPQQWPEDNDFDEDDRGKEPFDADDDFIRPAPPDTVIHEEPRVGRNDPCPCGSGKKFKKCCLSKAKPL